jgi:hypothetical protein
MKSRQALDKKILVTDPEIDNKKRQFEEYLVKQMVYKKNMVKKKQREFQNALKALGEVAEICQDGAGE